MFLIVLIFIAPYYANSRDYTKDIYYYDKSGLHFSNKDLGINKFYRRFEVQVKGIDVSKWQGVIDWEKVNNSGIKFAIIRDGYGKKSTKQIDRFFRINMKNVKEQGIPCGVYHYSYASNGYEARAEADFCLENVKLYKLEYPVAFDIEDYKLRYLGKNKLTDICRSFCDRIREKGYYVAIYTNFDWVNHLLYKDALFNKYDLWMARYNNWQAGYTCGIWQYSKCGIINGINPAKTCLNIAYFDYPKIIKELNLNGF